jgi:hypothetical protein
MPVAARARLVRAAVREAWRERRAERAAVWEMWWARRRERRVVRGGGLGGEGCVGEVEMTGRRGVVERAV